MIITGEPDELVAQIHPRMPVILPPATSRRMARGNGERELKRVTGPLARRRPDEGTKCALKEHELQAQLAWDREFQELKESQSLEKQLMTFQYANVSRAESRSPESIDPAG
jgi:hypothetical protein